MLVISFGDKRAISNVYIGNKSFPVHVNKIQQNVEIDSSISRGRQGKYGKFVLYICKTAINNKDTDKHNSCV
jgi:hypothetical protein